MTCASSGATPRSRPSSRTGRCAGAARTTRSSPHASTGRSTALDPPVLDVLRLGAHQLLGMRVPSHAAVATSVDLARATVGAGASRLVNAVLRRVADRDRDDLARGGRAAGRDAIPPRTSRSCTPTRGGSSPRSEPRSTATSAQTAAALEADNLAAGRHAGGSPGPRHPRRAGRARAPSPTRYSPWGAIADVRRPRRDRRRSPRAAPRSRTRAASSSRSRSRPCRSTATERVWLDVAAGPGGKAALLQGIAAERGIGYLAADRAPHRAGLVRAALDGAPGRWLVVAADGRSSLTAEGGVDRVLLDAPCSGLGALRRRPEARWRRLAADLPELTRLQRDLLGTALDAVRPGGVVAYVTCSPHPVETRQVVDAVVGRRDDVTLLDARPVSARTCRCSVPGRTSSSGRTATAPTRCTWRCCAGPEVGGNGGVRGAARVRGSRHGHTEGAVGKQRRDPAAGDARFRDAGGRHHGAAGDPDRAGPRRRRVPESRLSGSVLEPGDRGRRGRRERRAARIPDRAGDPPDVLAGARSRPGSSCGGGAQRSRCACAPVDRDRRRAGDRRTRSRRCGSVASRAWRRRREPS